MLVLTRKKDEKIIIGDRIQITVVEVEGGKVKLGIDAPDDIEIVREELYKKVEDENREAARGTRIDPGELLKLNLNGKSK